LDRLNCTRYPYAIHPWSGVLYTVFLYTFFISHLVKGIPPRF
jgi:hypothetical protein